MTLSSKICEFFYLFKRQSSPPKSSRKCPPPLFKGTPKEVSFPQTPSKPYCYELVFTLDDHKNLLRAVVVLSIPWSENIFADVQAKICADFGAEKLTLLECNVMQDMDQVPSIPGGYVN